jgi:hypothetical protein
MRILPILVLYSLSVAQPTLFCGDTLICNDLPQNIKEFIRTNLPEYFYPNVEMYNKFAEGIFVCKQRKLLSKEPNRWPPHFIEGDFNRDGLKDYVIVMSKRIITNSRDTSYSGHFVILHGTKKGFVIGSIEPAWNGGKTKFHLSCQIAFVKQGNYKVLNANGKLITIEIPYDGFMVYGEDDTEYYYWENGEYVNKAIYSWD